MNGLIAAFLCTIATVSAQGSYEGRESRRIRVPEVIDPGFSRGTRLPGVIDHGGVIGSGVIGHGLDRGVIGSGVIGRGIDRGVIGSEVIGHGLDRGVIGSGAIGHGSIGGNCYFGEEPSLDRNGRIDWCSYRYNYCYDPRATCRFRSGSTGTCCRRRRHIGGGAQYCRGTGTIGQGICYNQRQCRRQFGRRYECQFNRGSSGTCCLRFSSGIRY